VTHAHGDHFAGSKYLQDHFGPHIVLSAADWNFMEGVNSAGKPKRDMVATDGQKLTLGDTTLTMYVTPGHTPGTISLLIPVKDGGKQHLAAMWGGMTFNFQKTPEAFGIYANSAQRFYDIVAKSPVDVVLTNHPNHDKTLDKIEALQTRQPGGPHPFIVGNDAMKRLLQLVGECAKVNILRLSAPAKR
jgi:metallo-beta-lactamase class B